MTPVTLAIHKGIPQVPLDTRSFERAARDSLSLVNANGVSLVSWTPTFASIKSNAVYANSALGDGRTPLALPLDNVTQTLTISVSGSSVSGRAYVQRRLQEFARAAHNYWTTNWQIDPVWLEWEQTPGKPQYVLITRIDFAWQGDAFDVNQTQSALMTVTIEHLPYWRGLPPGDNPKKWAYHHNGTPLNFTSSNCSLIATGAHLVSATGLRNWMTWDTANSPYRSESAENFIDIPGTSVRGDSPALLELALEISHPSAAPSYTEVYIWRSSRDLSVTDRNNNQYSVGYNLNGDTAKAGGASSFTVTAAETTMTGKRVWTGDQAIPNTDLWMDKNLLRGRYIIFARMYQSTAGAVGNVRAQVRVIDQGSAATNTYVDGPEVSVQLTTALHYMGVFNIPLAERAEMSPDGNGMFVSSVPTAGVGNIPYNIGIQLQCRNTAGANRDIQFYDLVMMPIDEGACRLQAPSFTASGTYIQYLVDGTGYLARGKNEAVAKLITGNAAVTSGGPLPDDYGGEPVEVRGELPTLLPGVDQRIYIMVNTPAQAVPFTSPDQASSITAWLNIIPQWQGVRDA